jgi:hypothetical protein
VTRPDPMLGRRTMSAEVYNICGITLDDGSDCQADVMPDIGLNLCAGHLRRAYEVYRETGPRRRIEAEEFTLCPTCGETTMHPGDAGRKCGWCGYETADFVGGDMLDIAAMVPNFRVENEKRVEKRVAVVYYIAFGDRIKIGTSVNLRKRLQELPFDKVLAIEPGGISVEHRRHEQFAHTRVRGEWFEHSPQLLAHIESLQRPPLGWQNILSELEQQA